VRVRIIVHGIVQGVGYRYLVRRMAKLHGISGSVRNVPDGSVEIIAVANESALKEFERSIQVHEEYGPQVMKIERAPLEGSEKKENNEADFIIM
jgi:acylphosphatase